ncbi:MAG: GNAT family N-acetyltransferase, partial [Candidatus Parcubacteria bacterium]|nr:GNAT family N-acetyltransferase [Burkholderiales bacterium]
RVPAPQVAPQQRRGYLRAGAWICGEPALDPEFNTADFFLLLPLERLAPRHARHFFGEVLRVG